MLVPTIIAIVIGCRRFNPGLCRLCNRLRDGPGMIRQSPLPLRAFPIFHFPFSLAKSLLRPETNVSLELPVSQQTDVAIYLANVNGEFPLLVGVTQIALTGDEKKKPLFGGSRDVRHWPFPPRLKLQCRLPPTNLAFCSTAVCRLRACPLVAPHITRTLTRPSFQIDKFQCPIGSSHIAFLSPAWHCNPSDATTSAIVYLLVGSTSER